MDGRHKWASTLIPTVAARRLWTRFELLPFRYGVTLIASTIAAAALFVTALMTLGSDSGGSSRGGTHAPARRTPVEAAVPPQAPTWGAYVPPKQNAAVARASAPPRVASVSPRPRPTHSSTRSATPTTSCPPNVRKWPWMWELCKRKKNG